MEGYVCKLDRAQVDATVHVEEVGEEMEYREVSRVGLPVLTVVHQFVCRVEGPW